MEFQHDVEAENAVLGCLMLDGLGALERCQGLEPQMFFLSTHRVVFRAIREIAESGRQPDHLLVREILQQRGEFESIGGVLALADIGKDIPRRFDPADHVSRIVEKWRLREGSRICARYAGRFESGESADELLAGMQSETLDAIQLRPGHADPLVLDYSVAALNAFLSPTPEQAGLAYGVAPLDRFTTGMRARQVTVIGARSGVGKTSMMCQAAALHCPQGTPMNLFSLELSKEEILQRLWSIASGVPFAKVLDRQRCSLDDIARIKTAALAVAEWPLRIHDDPGMTVEHIASLARVSARRHGMKILALDYVQICNADGKDERTRVANVSRTLTKLAKVEGVHALLLSQLRKASTAADANRPPVMDDLRESSQLANDAHLVVLLHRPWDEQTGGLSMDAEIIVPKQRNGRTGTKPAMFDGRTLTFNAPTMGTTKLRVA